MPSLLKRVLTVLLSVLIAPAGVFLYHETVLKALSGSHHGVSGFLLAVIGFFEVGSLQLVFSSVLIAGGVFGLAYGLTTVRLLIEQNQLVGGAE
jgi:hypothetical protein